MKKDLKEIYNQENIAKLLDRNSTIEEINEFDLKMEMIKYPSLEKLYNENIKEYLNLDFEELFNPAYILERYIVFKQLAKIKYQFDCDKLPFVKKVYGVKNSEPCDTLLSIQSIYNKVISNKPFLEQLSIIEELKKSVYYDDICRLIIYYHTIGNMCPCPKENKYNMSKYNRNPKGFDRLDFFKNTTYFQEKNFKAFFSDEFLEEYCLKEIYDGTNLPDLDTTNKIFQELKEKEIKKYINTYIELIMSRTKLLYKKRKF